MTVLDTALDEAVEIEKAQVEGIKRLNERATTIYTYLIGGSSVFAGIASLVAFVNLGSIGTVDVSFYKYAITTTYVRAGVLFYATGVLFALLAGSLRQIGTGVDPEDLLDVYEGRIRNEEEWRQEKLETVYHNIEQNSQAISQKASFVVTALLATIFSFVFFVAGLMRSVEHLQRAAEGGYYYVPPELVPAGPEASSGILVVCLALYVVVVLAYLPLVGRLFPSDRTTAKLRRPRSPSAVRFFVHASFVFLIVELGYVGLVGETSLDGLGLLLGGIVVSMLGVVVLVVIGAGFKRHAVYEHADRIRIAEIETGERRVAFENVSDAALDLSGWTVTRETSNSLRRFEFPSNVALSPGGKVLLYFGQNAPAYPDDSPSWEDDRFVLGWPRGQTLRQGDKILVRNRSDVVQCSGVVPPERLWIAEIETGERRVAFENVSDAALDLSGWTVEQEFKNSLRRFEFPSNVVLSPGERVVLYSGRNAPGNPDDGPSWEDDGVVLGWPRGKMLKPGHKIVVRDRAEAVQCAETVRGEDDS